MLIHKKCKGQVYAHHGQDGFYCSGCDEGWSVDDIDEAIKKGEIKEMLNKKENL